MFKQFLTAISGLFVSITTLVHVSSTPLPIVATLSPVPIVTTIPTPIEMLTPRPTAIHANGPVVTKNPIYKPVAKSNSDQIVQCNISKECGGGTISLRQSECSISICCGFGNRWVFYKDKSKCDVDQKKDSDTWKAAAEVTKQATQQSIDNQNKLMETYKQQMENSVNKATSQMNSISNQPVNVQPINGTITDPNPKSTPIVPVGYGYSP